MKKMICLMFMVLLSASCSVHQVSAERPSCVELVEIALELDGIADEFSDTDVIVEGGRIDMALEDLVDGLLVLADLEQDPSLTKAVEGMDDAWIAMDADRFENQLALVILNFERLFLRDCR